MTLWNAIATTRVEARLNSSWTDITGYVLMGTNGAPIEGGISRQTELALSEPSNLTFVLDDRDGRFTSDNTTGAYYPYWKVGTKIRWTETIGAKTFRWPDMWVETIETIQSFESASDPTHTDRHVRVSCIDLLTKLNRAPAFRSNHTEWVLYHVAGSVGSALEVYYPLIESDGSRHLSAGPTRRQPLRATTRADLHAVAQVRVVPTEDTTGPSLTANSTPSGAVLTADLSPTVSASDSEAITLSAWLLLDVAQAGTVCALSGVGSLTVEYTATAWTVTLSQVGTATFASAPPIGYPFFLSIRADQSTGEMALYIDGQLMATTTQSTPVTPNIFTSIAVGPFDGAVQHLQLVVDAPGDYPATALRDQYLAGRDGLVRQRVDERIRTICLYAGVDDGLLELQESSSVMQEARFAGASPGSLVTAASVTGGGVALTDDRGLVYQDRVHRFDL